MRLPRHLYGAQVTMDYAGTTLLGDVTGSRRDEGTGIVTLTVRHFNGDPWPTNPLPHDVTVLERDYPASDDTP